MKSCLNLSRYKKCRLWVNDFRNDYIINSNRVIKGIINLDDRPNSLYEKAQMAIEVFMGSEASSYALVGFCFYPDDQYCNKIEVSVIVNATDVVYENSLAYGNETVKIGIPDEYSDAILKSAVKTITETNAFPPGNFVFNIGAHSNVGSSPVVFALATKLLLTLFRDNIKNMNDEQLRDKIESLLSRRIFDNYDFLKAEQ